MGNKSKRLQYDACPAKRYHGGAYGRTVLTGYPDEHSALQPAVISMAHKVVPDEIFRGMPNRWKKRSKKRQDFEIGKDIGEHDKNGDISPHYGDGGNA